VREATLTTRLFRARKQIAARLTEEPEREQPRRGTAGGREEKGAGGVLSSGGTP